MNSPGGDTGVQKYWTLLSLFPVEGVRPATKLLGHMVVVFLFYFSEGMPYCFAVVLIYISPKRV